MFPTNTMKKKNKQCIFFFFFFCHLNQLITTLSIDRITTNIVKIDFVDGLHFTTYTTSCNKLIFYRLNVSAVMNFFIAAGVSKCSLVFSIHCFKNVIHTSYFIGHSFHCVISKVIILYKLSARTSTFAGMPQGVVG